MLSVSSLLEKPSVTQDQNTRATENSIIHVERSEKIRQHQRLGLSMGYGILRHPCVVWSCVTLGFSNSVALLTVYYYQLCRVR
jgi:hypothetical protein